MKRPPIEKVDTSVDAFDVKASTYDLPEIGARIKVARKAVGLTQEALALLAGAKSKSGLQDNEAGKNMPGGQMIRALVRAGINANWLLTGDGPMLLSDLLPKIIEVPVPAQINVGALAAIIAAVEFTRKTASAPERAAIAANAYAASIQEGMITPTGPGMAPDTAA